MLQPSGSHLLRDTNEVILIRMQVCSTRLQHWKQVWRSLLCFQAGLVLCAGGTRSAAVLSKYHNLFCKVPDVIEASQPCAGAQQCQLWFWSLSIRSRGI